MGLRQSGHALTLIMLYLVTLIMRAAFYVTIAVISSSVYMGGALVGWGVAVVLAIYPLAELSTVSFFGSYSDKIGRKPILAASLFITALAAFLFGVATIQIVAFVLAGLFGIGAASKVTTTLSIIADCSSEENRARLMGYYDLSTLVGLAGGFGLGIILLEIGSTTLQIGSIVLEIAFTPTSLLFAAAGACALTGVLTILLIKETRVVSHEEVSMLALLKQVARDKRIQLMLPVYIPIISLYGLVISKTKYIIETYFDITAMDMIVLFGMLGGALILGIIIMGHLSDYMMKRRPFIVFGLIGFGALAYMLVANAEAFDTLWTSGLWPLLPILGFIAGSFPPAAMAYLTDISSAEARGSTMGVYSIFFGSGMIIGPLAAEFAYSVGGLFPGLAILVVLLITVACIGTYFLKEAAPQKHAQEKSLIQ
ncbi:MAG: MFS transporter [Candidatus Thorarchaeota archaeon]|nr:MFS transporter [Candidatus Thorarchaeota archaeon]